MYENDVALFDENILWVKLDVIEIGKNIWQNMPKNIICSNPDSQIRIMLPETLKVIYPEAFCGIQNIIKIFIPDSVTKMPVEGTKGTFEGCTRLEEIKLSDRLVVIPKYAFSRCVKLKNVIIPNGIELISYSAFNECESLEEIIIPDTVKVLGRDIFKNCLQLKRIKLSNKLVEIPANAFFHCATLRNIIIPNGIRRIGREAFHHCKSLEKITIPNTVEGLKSDIFQNCMELKEIKAPRHLVATYGEEYIKCGTNAIITTYDGIIKEEDIFETQSTTANQQKTSAIKSYNGVGRRNLIAEKRKAIKSHNGNPKK